jgi:hypothetical protein
MPVWAQILLGLFGASGAIGTIVLGILKAKDDRLVRQETNTRADRSDIVTMLTNDVQYWRARSERAEEKVDQLQAELMSTVRDADHAADVAQAALLAFRQGKAEATSHGTS